MEKLLVRIKEEWKEELQNIADNQGQTLSALIKQILWDYLNKEGLKI